MHMKIVFLLAVICGSEILCIYCSYGEDYYRYQHLAYDYDYECELPLVKGRPCRAMLRRYYFDKNSKKCRQFIYGGCKGNANNFETIEECKKKCEEKKPSRLPRPPGPRPPRPLECKLPLVKGPCLALFRHYYFDKNSKKCRQFIYGGCEGNANNFGTIEECKEKCEDEPQPPGPSPPPPPVCNMAPEIGPCNEKITRYYYCDATEECRPFPYGGCKGNANNFKTKEECESLCLGHKEQTSPRRPPVTSPRAPPWTLPPRPPGGSCPPCPPCRECPFCPPCNCPPCDEGGPSPPLAETPRPPSTNVCDPPLPIRRCKSGDVMYYFNKVAGKCMKAKPCASEKIKMRRYLFNTYKECRRKCGGPTRRPPPPITRPPPPPVVTLPHPPPPRPSVTHPRPTPPRVTHPRTTRPPMTHPRTTRPPRTRPPRPPGGSCPPCPPCRPCVICPPCNCPPCDEGGLSPTPPRFTPPRRTPPPRVTTPAAATAKRTCPYKSIC